MRGALAAAATGGGGGAAAIPATLPVRVWPGARPAFAVLSRRVGQVSRGALRLVEGAGPANAAFGGLAFAPASPGPVLELFAGFPFGMSPRELGLWAASPEGRALWAEGFAARGLLAFPCRVLASPGVLPASSSSAPGPAEARTLCPAFGTLLDLALPSGNLAPLGPDALGWLSLACDGELAASTGAGGAGGPGMDTPRPGAGPRPLAAGTLAARAAATAAGLRERVPAHALAAYAAARHGYWRGGAAPLTA